MIAILPQGNFLFQKKYKKHKEENNASRCKQERRAMAIGMNYEKNMKRKAMAPSANHEKNMKRRVM